MIYIALLRGINVSGHKKIPMAELRSVLEKSGLEDVGTYIQTGNVFFNSRKKSVDHLETHIHKVIKSHFGFEVMVIIKKPADIQRIINNCPFSEHKKLKSYFTLLKTIPSEELIAEAIKKQYLNEEYHILDDCIYFFCEAGAGKAKFNMNFFERKLNTVSTTRNYNTMMKLLSLSSEK